MTTTERLMEVTVSATPGRRVPPSRLASLRALVRRGLRDRRRAPLTWGLPLGAMSALEIALYPSVEDSLSDLVKSYPSGLKEAFRIDQLNSVEAFLDAEMLSLIVPLAVAFFAIRSVARAIPGLEEQGHLDALLATPLPRRVLVAGSLVVTALATAAVLGVLYAASMLADLLAGTDLSAAKLAAGIGNVWPLAFFFAGLATLATAFARRSATVTAIAAGTLMAMYVIDLVGKVADPAEPFRVVSVFKYYGSAIQDGIDPLAFAGVTLAGVLLAAVGALMFERRDLR
jgi:ABC-2 type transport system permease protein